jgi:hypothetical protein
MSKGIYSFFYSGGDHMFYVKIGYSKDISRRMREHKMTNPTLEEGPTIKTALSDFTTESIVHKMCKSWFEEIASEHYKLTVEDRLNFDDIFTLVENTLNKKWKIMLDKCYST